MTGPSATEFHERAQLILHEHKQRLNTLLCGYIIWSVLCGEDDNARTMSCLNALFGDWLERSYRPALRGVRGLG